jgi:hypothetical protein
MTETIGSGRRFRGLAAKLAKKSAVKNPSALAAHIGRQKYGSDRMQALAAAGRRREAAKPPQEAAETRARARRVKV